ncbi:hypothetical protein BC374_24180 [Ensifer sp. LC13]|nr:hypothetical protein BC362_25135 [Ensifer sp. LC14]OCP06127.1 hypothetical protein BBX50_23960 [Ensifer sp. LC11]OCP07076.1 hypothetical protein BC374_24180 [Ensifer sp. LC13]OCP31470.1 hypothetical protein BC364_23475 [Ensifer sp. LC499]
MPVRRKANKRRSGEVEAWAIYFQSGHDFFDELGSLGLTEESARPIAEETWRRIGADVITYLDRFYDGYHPPARPYWAEAEFGPADTRKRRPFTRASR